MQPITLLHRWPKAGILLVLAVIATYGAVGFAGAESDSPPGNNGHVQIDEFVMDDEVVSNANDPQVACGFSVTFFGYDAGDQQATITVTPWEPTGGGTPFTVAASWHIDERTGGNQLDHNQQITPEQLAAAFAGIEPAAQGFHVRVDVSVTGSQGADEKHKVIWVEPCETATTPTTVVPGTTPAEAAHDAAVAAVAEGASAEEATAAAAAAAMAAGATAEEAAVLAQAAVAATAITPAVPAGAVVRPGSATG